MSKLNLPIAIIVIFFVYLMLSGCAEKADVPIGSTSDDTHTETAPVTAEAEGTTPETEPTGAATTEAEPMGRGAKPPIMEPEDLPFDEETTELANEIISELDEGMALIRSILCNEEMEGDEILLSGTYWNGDTFENYTFMPFKEPYDTVDKCMEIFHRVYTDEHCEKLYSQYFIDRYIREVDGKLYGELIAYPWNWFDLPIQNAVRVSDDEIIAITTITYHDTGESDYYEITLKNENSEWRVAGRFRVDYYGEGTWYEEDC